MTALKGCATEADLKVGTTSVVVLAFRPYVCRSAGLQASLNSALALSRKISWPCLDSNAAIFHAHLEAMPAARCDPLRRVADEISHAELFEDLGKRGREIFRGFDPKKSSTGCLAEIARKARASLADFDAIYHHIATACGFEYRIGGEPARRVDTIAKDNQE